MTRPTRWHRGAGDGTILLPHFAFFVPDAFMNDNETLVRLRWRYQILASSPGGTLIAMLHPGAHAVVTDDHSFLIGLGNDKNPLIRTDSYSDTGRTWLWWESWTYQHWLPQAADTRWIGPADVTERDSHAQRIQTGGLVPNNYSLGFVWGIRDDIDWEINDVYVSYSALVMSA